MAFRPDSPNIATTLIYTVAATVLLTIALQFLLFGVTIFAVQSQQIQAFFNISALIIGIQFGVYAVHDAMVLTPGIPLEEDDGEYDPRENIPEYGYHDQWEKENL